MKGARMRESEKQVAGLEAYVERGDFSRYYGIQYGDPKSDAWPWREQVMGDLLLNIDGTVLEIGAGGGRWSQFIVPEAKRSILVDGTPASEAAIRGHFAWNADVEFVVSEDGKMPTVPDASVDFVWSFDTFVHFDDRLFWQYCREVARVLRSGGRFMLYYAWDETAEKPFFRYYDPAEVERKMKRYGLKHCGEDVLIMDARMSMWERAKRRK